MNQYEVICQIGSGSYGKVYKIIRKSDKKVLIWKEMRLEGIPENGRKLIENEISILRELDHPNIVKQYETFTDDSNSKLYIVMEYCEKGDLDKLILQNKNNNKFVDEDLIWDILVQSLNALKYMHNDRKILHRDIKPSNIFLDKYYKIKLGDFGLSRKYFTQYANTILGTPLYMAPEMLEKKQYNVEADIWALGCSIYELTNFVVPFEAQNMEILLNKIRNGPLKRINNIYSEYLWNIVSKMLIYDYKQRPSSSDLLEECNKIVSIRNNMFNIKNRNEIQAKWDQLMLYDLKLQMMERQVNERGQIMNIKDKELMEREQKVLEKEINVNKAFDEMIKKNKELKAKNKMLNFNTFNNNTKNKEKNEVICNLNKNNISNDNNNDDLNEKINQNKGFINNQSVNENKKKDDTNEDGVLDEIPTNDNNNLIYEGNNNDNYFNNNNNINESKINNNNNNNQNNINDNSNSNENNKRINSNHNNNNKELILGDTMKAYYENVQKKIGQNTNREMNKKKLNNLNNTKINKKNDIDLNKNKIISNKNNNNNDIIINDINNNQMINNNNINNNNYNNLNNNQMINNNNTNINNYNYLNNNQMINSNNINNNNYNSLNNNLMINNNNGIIYNNQMINNVNINNEIYNNLNNKQMINNNFNNNIYNNLNNNINNINNNNHNYINNNLNNNNMINCNNNNNNYNNQNDLKNKILNKNDNEKKESLTQYSFYKNNKKFPKIGLINLGDTSYLNAVIQSLVNIEDLALYFLDSDKMNYLDSVKNELPLSYEMKEIFCNLYPPKEESIENSYAPLSLLEYISKDKKYSYEKSSNPIYLIKDLLNGLDNELNTLFNNNVEDNENKYDREETIYSEMNYISKTNNSPIFRIFCFTKVHESICEKYCNSIYDLKKYNSFKLNISKYYSLKKEKIKIKDCIRFQYEESEKTKLFICQNCHKKKKYFVYSKIFSSPNIFLFLIDRGTDIKQNKNELLKIPLIIEDQLDLDGFIENKETPTKYELIGIVSILIKDEKYVSMCKSPIDNNWYNYNDEEIQKIEHKKVIELCNNYEMYSPCIVIYKAANKNNK